MSCFGHVRCAAGGLTVAALDVAWEMSVVASGLHFSRSKGHGVWADLLKNIASIVWTKGNR